MDFTYDELNLMWVHDRSDGHSRLGLIRDLKRMRSYLVKEEVWLRNLTDAAVAKLEDMTDEEFAGLNLDPDIPMKEVT